jgi:hypothetical protein
MLQLGTIQVLSFVHGKAAWKLRPQDSKFVNGREFLKLARTGTQYGFCRLVYERICEESPHDIAHTPFAQSTFSLTASKGYAELMALRNTAQSAELRQVEKDLRISAMAALFQKKPADETPAAKRARVSREKIREASRNPDVIAITVDDGGDVFDLEVVRPLHPNDEIAVKLDTDTIERVIRYIVNQGFDLHQAAGKKELPPGVHRRPNGKYAVFQHVDGIKRNKTVRSLDHACRIAAEERDKVEGVGDYDAIEDGRDERDAVIDEGEKNASGSDDCGAVEDDDERDVASDDNDGGEEQENEENVSDGGAEEEVKE